MQPVDIQGLSDGGCRRAQVSLPQGVAWLGHDNFNNNNPSRAGRVVSYLAYIYLLFVCYLVGF
jgi:hypothetical protein